MWEVIYWVLLVIAFVVLGRGLLWDRAGFRGRPKRRCRKCWYDLTGVDGDVSREPVVCPECGRAHKTKRSMRKTRRGKRWVVAALGLWMLAYGASVTPKVQQSGWGAAVPETAWVLALPFLSEEVGSGVVSRTDSRAGMKSSWFDKAVLENIQPFASPSHWKTQYGREMELNWVARRLVFLLARLESTDALTNRATAKGCAYKRMIQHLVLSDSCLESERLFAGRCVYIESEVDGGFAPDEPVYGILKFRSLLAGRFEIELGNGLEHGNAYWRDGVGFNGMMPSFASAVEEAEYLEEWLVWDWFSKVSDRGRVAEQAYSQAVLFGFAARERGEHVLQVPVRVVFEPIWGSIIDVELTGPRESISHEFIHHIPYVVDPSLAMEEVDDAEKYIEQAGALIDAELLVKNWSDLVDRLLHLRLKRDLRGKFDPEQFLFGGDVKLLIIPDESEGEPVVLMRSAKPIWWVWGKPNRIGESYSPTARNQDEIWRVRYRELGFTPVEDQWVTDFEAFTDTTFTHGRFVLRIDPVEDGAATRYGGMWSERVLNQPLEFEVLNWTVEEMRQFVVDGIAPIHSAL